MHIFSSSTDIPQPTELSTLYLLTAQLPSSGKISYKKKLPELRILAGPQLKLNANAFRKKASTSQIYTLIW
jgi:hypothetical protein